MTISELLNQVMANCDTYHSNPIAQPDRFFELGLTEEGFLVLIAVALLKPSVQFIDGFAFAMELMHEIKLQEELKELENLVK